jgi:8-oxo-dGTP pyrophosphatase MutT (NUDIX family)
MGRDSTGGGREAWVSARLRKTARVVLLDELGRILLFHFEDARIATHPRNRGGRPFAWCTPGGGVHEGESFEEGARRELWEETELRDAELGPCVWVREIELELDGEWVRSDQRYYLVRVPGHEVNVENMEDFERGFHRGHRWWRAEEIAASDDLFFPEDLAELLPPLAAGRVPTEPVVIQT